MQTSVSVAALTVPGPLTERLCFELRMVSGRAVNGDSNARAIEIRNPKSEIRKKSECRNPKSRRAFGRELEFRPSAFGLLSDFGFRISDFIFLHIETPARDD